MIGDTLQKTCASDALEPRIELSQLAFERQQPSAEVTYGF